MTDKINLDPPLHQSGFNPELPSRAVIAADAGGNGCVLWWVGHCLAMEIEEGGLSQLGDLGLDDAPHGISVWEGRYVWSPGPYECPQDGDAAPDGKFRPPTVLEWAAITAGRAPWNEDDWRIPVSQLVCGALCDHGSECCLPAGHQPADRHDTQHGCIFYDGVPQPNAAGQYPASTKLYNGADMVGCQDGDGVAEAAYAPLIDRKGSP